MSKAEKRSVRMILGARGDDGEHMERGKTYSVGRGFARQLVNAGKAEYDESAPKKVKGK